MQLPDHFCWSRFGTEAGEEVDHIIRRKECERVANGGVFLWGIGNALGPSMATLLRLEPNPEVIFSPIRSAPRKIDVAPSGIVYWRAAKQIDGSPYKLPAASVVTSRAKNGCNRHYALVCSSDMVLKVNLDLGKIALGKIRNLVSNSPVGFSQVTAVVKQEVRKRPYSDLTYAVAMRFKLAAPYLVELHEPAVYPSN